MEGAPAPRDSMGTMRMFFDFLQSSIGSMFLSDTSFSAQAVTEACQDAQELAREEERTDAPGVPDEAVAHLLDAPNSNVDENELRRQQDAAAAPLAPAAPTSDVAAVVQSEPPVTEAPAPAPVVEAVPAVASSIEKDELRESEEDVVHPDVPSYYREIDKGGPLAASVENTLLTTIQDILGQAKLHRLLAYLAMHPHLRLRRVLRPDLEEQFRATWAMLKEKYPDPADKNYVRPRIAFHGTKIHLVDKITETGLRVPDGEKVTHTCDTGWWGKGIYTSHDPEYSSGYSEDGRLIVVAVLCGKVFNCVERRDGGQLEAGYDSHVAENGCEWVLFNAGQVLPLFVMESRDYVPPPPPQPFEMPPIADQPQNVSWDVPQPDVLPAFAAAAAAAPFSDLNPNVLLQALSKSQNNFPTSLTQSMESLRALDLFGSSEALPSGPLTLFKSPLALSRVDLSSSADAVMGFPLFGSTDGFANVKTVSAAELVDVKSSAEGAELRSLFSSADTVTNSVVSHKVPEVSSSAEGLGSLFE